MSARDEGLKRLSLPDLDRRMANMVRYGTVEEVDYPNKRIRVKSGKNTTAWLPWSVGRAGAGKRRWDAPEVGEQVVMLCPSGDLRQACVLPGVYRDAHDAPVTDVNKDHVTYGDGTTMEYDRSSHTVSINLGPTSLVADRSQVVISCNGSTITMNAAGVTIVGTMIHLNP